MPGEKQLTERQRQFVEHYMTSGIASAAAIAAGYSANTAAEQSSRLLRNVGVKSAIAARITADTAVATRKERQAFWTSTFRDASKPGMERLKASELLARSHADFIDRTELTGPNGGPIQIGTTVVHELIQAPSQAQLAAPSSEDDGSDV